MHFSLGNPFLYASCTLLALGELQSRMENSYDEEKIYGLFCFQQSTQNYNSGTGKGWYHETESLILLKAWKKRKKLLFYLIQMHDAGSKARKQIKRKKNCISSSQVYIFLFLFFPPLSLDPVRKLGQAGAILFSPASTTLLSAWYNLFQSCLSYEVAS